MPLNIASLIKPQEVIETYELDGKTYKLLPEEQLPEGQYIRLTQARSKFFVLYADIFGKEGAEAFLMPSEESDEASTMDKIKEVTGKSDMEVASDMQILEAKSVTILREMTEAMLGMPEGMLAGYPASFSQELYNELQKKLNEYNEKKAEASPKSTAKKAPVKK